MLSITTGKINFQTCNLIENRIRVYERRCDKSVFSQTIFSRAKVFPPSIVYLGTWQVFVI